MLFLVTLRTAGQSIGCLFADLQDGIIVDTKMCTSRKFQKFLGYESPSLLIPVR